MKNKLSIPSLAAGIGAAQGFFDVAHSVSNYSDSFQTKAQILSRGFAYAMRALELGVLADRTGEKQCLEWETLN